MNRFRLWIAATAVLVTAATGTALTGNEVLARHREAIGRVDSYRAEYVLSQADDTTVGVIIWKRPRYLRFVHRGTLMISDGETMWVYTPDAHTLVIADDAHTLVIADDAGDDGLAAGAAPLMDVTDIELQSATYIGIEDIDGVSCHLLDIVPAASEQAQRVRAWIARDTWMTKRVRLSSRGGLTTTYTLTGVQLNPALPESTFALTAPPNATTVDMRARR